MDSDRADATDVAGSLPVALTRLVGRQRELRDLAALLGGTRLLTLIGTGGSGKTRLGLALAAASRGRYREGAWWIELASVTGPEPIPAAVAAALGVPQAPGQDPAAAVIRHLRARQALLVFDNCEQIVAGCAELIERLLRSCPHLTVVATSREVLGVPGERVFRVDGLGLPVTDEEDAEAVELFTERAAALNPGFIIGLGERPAVARLCRQLDGLPLALELAAARAGVLGVTEIARRLPGNVAVLRNPSRLAPERHQTLEATLDWSYRLLTRPERLLFRRVSCFSGSFSLTAAEAVTAGPGLDAADVPGLLATLVSKSLVLAGGPDSAHRYRMLETIRDYARRRLAGSEEATAVRDACAAYYLRLAEEAHAGLEGVGQAGWLDLLEAEHDNLRSVLRRALGPAGSPAGSPAGAQAGARLAALMWPFWYRRGYYQEARAWLERAADLAARKPVSAPVMASVLTGAGVLAFLQCDYVVAAERLAKARAVYEEEDDQVGLATALQRLGSIAREEGRYADARRLHEESMAIWAALGDAAGVAASQDYLGFAAWLSGDAATAAGLCAAAVAAFRAAGRRQETAAALVNHGVAVWLSGDAAEGAELLQSSLDIATGLGYQEGIAWALHELAVIICADDPATAADMLRESLEIHASLGDRWRIASVVETIASLVASSPAVTSLAVTSLAGAAKLMGGAAGLRRSLGTPVPPAERRAYDQCERTLRERLGVTAFRSAWRLGEPMELDELIDLALQASLDFQDSVAAAAATGAGAGAGAAGAAGLTPAAPTPAEVYGLTGRELDVLRLLSQGLTNREIGQALLISTGTAGVHVSNILRKLDVSSRVQAVAVAHRLGLPPA